MKGKIDEVKGDNQAEENCVTKILRHLLSEKTIRESCIDVIPVNEAERELHCKLPDVESICRIPYAGTEFCRYFAYHTERLPEFLQKKGWSRRLYIPRQARKHLGYVKKELLIVDTELEALRRCQNGECSVCFPDIWSSSERIIAWPFDFDQIKLENREILVMPDPDWFSTSAERYGYRQIGLMNPARLVYMLNEKGANASIVPVSVLNEDGTVNFRISSESQEPIQKKYN